jgi:Diguanylate cyclase, GGDEF domain
MLMDLGRFKGVNHTLGHDYGDRVLRTLGPPLAECVNSDWRRTIQGSRENIHLLRGPMEPKEEPHRSRALDVLGHAALRRAEQLSNELELVTASIALDVGRVVGVLVVSEDRHTSMLTRIVDPSLACLRGSVILARSVGRVAVIARVHTRISKSRHTEGCDSHSCQKKPTHIYTPPS